MLLINILLQLIEVFMPYLKPLILGIVMITASGCVHNHVTQHTHSHSVAQVVAPPARVAPAAVVLPVVHPVPTRHYESGSFASGAYFYRRYQ